MLVMDPDVKEFILGALNAGWKPTGVYPVGGKWRLIFTRQKKQKTRVFASEEEAQEALEYARSLYEERERLEKGPEHDIELWWTRIRDSQPLLKGIVEKVSWMQDAIYDLGFFSLLVSMQTAKVTPENLYQLVERFRDKDEFLRYAMRHMVALLEASRDAARILELEDRARLLAAQLEFTKWVAERLREERDTILLDLRTAIASMDAESLRKFSNAKVLSGLAPVEAGK